MTSVRLRAYRLCVLIMSCGFAALLVTTHARAADSALSASVTPQEVALTPGASASVILVLTNSGTSPAMNIAIQPVPADGSMLVKRQSTGDVTVVLAGSSLRINYSVTRMNEGTSQDIPIVFVVTYTQGTTGSTQSLLASMVVKAAANLSIIVATIASNVSNINANRPGEAALLITNPRETTVSVGSIQVTAPESVDVTLACGNDRLLKTPGGATHAFTATDCP